MSTPPKCAIARSTAASISARLVTSICSGRAAGFGACDADFNSLFFQFGMNPFALHASDPSGPWFVDPTQVPHS